MNDKNFSDNNMLDDSKKEDSKLQEVASLSQSENSSNNPDVTQVSNLPQSSETETSNNSNTDDDIESKKLSDAEIEAIIDEVKSDKTLESFEDAQLLEDLELEKKDDGKKPLKLNKIYRIKFSERQFEKKLLKRIFIPNDKKYVKSFFVKTTEEIKGKPKTFFTFTDKSVARKDIIRLNRIARDIKKQKGRINLIPLVAAFAVVVLILVFAYFFRNIISRNIVVSASEGAFGAKCDIGYIDFDLFDTHFQIKDYAVANKNAPMKNLFEIKNIDIYFDLLELSRGKFVCKNIAIDGISWNTNRTVSGAIAKKPKPKKNKDSILNNNPITKMVDEELAMIKDGVSISAGLDAIREYTDPKLILQREINAFQSPKIKDEILDFVPTFVEDWKTEVNNVYTDVQTMIDKGKDFAEIDFQSIDSVEKVYEVVSKLKILIEASERNIKNVESLGKKIESDAQEVKTLAENIENYIRSDFAHIKQIAADIKEIKAKGASGFVSDLFRIFYLEALGSYYPRLMYIIDTVNDMQKSPKKEKPPTFADKSRNLERLDGRNFLFSDHSAPSLLFRNIQLSANTPEKKFTIAGNVQNITNDADKLNKPITLALSSTQNQFRENVKGIVDLRRATSLLVNVQGDFSGLDLALDANITGLPKLEGAFTTDVEVEIGKNNDLKIITKGVVNNALLTIESFEPAFLSRIYSEVLARITTVDIVTSLYKPINASPALKISTSVDEQIFASIKKQLQIEIARIRDMVIAEGKKYLEQIRTEYLSEIAYSDEIIEMVKLAFTDSQAFKKMLQSKLKEAEARAKELTMKAANKVKDKATEKINETKQQIENEVQKQVEDATKDIKDQLKDTIKNPFGW